MNPRFTADSISQVQEALPLSAWAKGLIVFHHGAFNHIWENTRIDTDLELACPQFPLSSIGYLVDSSTPIAEIIHGFSLGRLGGIRQLGFLTQPVVLREENRLWFEHFPHNRFTHSLDAATLMALMLENNQERFTEAECLHGFIATLLHDHGTPAGGDTTKLLSRDDFDEDRHFAQVFDTESAQRTLKRHNLDPEKLTAIVQETNLLGKLKDIADKLAYICRDAHTFMQSSYVSTPGGELCYRGVQQILATEYSIGDLWQDVRVIDDQIVFSDPERLTFALLLRVVLTHDLYYNPLSRSYGFVISQAIMRQMYEAGALTRASLLQMADLHLTEAMEDWTGHSTWEIKTKLSSGTSFQAFTSIRQAQAFADEKRKVTPFVLLEDFSRSLNVTGTDWLVQTSSGIQPLREAFPDETKLIDDIAQSARQITVYWINNPHPELLASLKRKSG